MSSMPERVASIETELRGSDGICTRLKEIEKIAYRHEGYWNIFRFIGILLGFVATVFKVILPEIFKWLLGK